MQPRNDSNPSDRGALCRRVVLFVRSGAMRALTKILAGGAFVAALISAAPAAAQYYPGYGNPGYGYGGGNALRPGGQQGLRGGFRKYCGHRVFGWVPPAGGEPKRPGGPPTAARGG